jgi:hypothetical protein
MQTQIRTAVFTRYNLSQLNPHKILKFCLIKTHYNVILPYKPGSLTRSLAFRFYHQIPLQISCRTIHQPRVLRYGHVFGVPWLIISGSGFDDWIYYHFLVQSTRTYKQYSPIADLYNLKLTVTHAVRFPVFISRILVTELKQSFTGWLLILLRLLTSGGPLLSTTLFVLLILILVLSLSLVLLVLFYSTQLPSKESWLGSHRKHTLFLSRIVLRITQQRAVY